MRYRRGCDDPKAPERIEFCRRPAIAVRESARAEPRKKIEFAVVLLLSLFVVVAAGRYLPVHLGVLSSAPACLIGVILDAMKLTAVIADFPAGLCQKRRTRLTRCRPV